MQQCIQVRRHLPNVLAVDFFGLGDTTEVVDTWNAAVATVTGVASTEDNAVERLRLDPATTDVALEQLENLPSLPEMSLATAKKLLGPVAKELERPSETLEITEITTGNIKAGPHSRINVKILPSQAPSAKPS